MLEGRGMVWKWEGWMERYWLGKMDGKEGWERKKGKRWEEKGRGERREGVGEGRSKGSKREVTVGKEEGNTQREYIGRKGQRAREYLQRHVING